MSTLQIEYKNTTSPLAYVQWTTWKIDESHKHARHNRHTDVLEAAWQALQQGQVVYTQKVEVAAHRTDDLRGITTIATVTWHDTVHSWRSWTETGLGLLTVQTLHKAVDGCKRRRCTSISYFVSQTIIIDYPIWYSSARPFCDEDFIWNSVPIFSRNTEENDTSTDDVAVLLDIVTIE